MQSWFGGACQLLICSRSIRVHSRESASRKMHFEEPEMVRARDRKDMDSWTL
jgi:hypothetical protein